MKNKKILVTGGAGFLGSHLCERLLNDGNEVLCLDNLFTGSKTNIIHLFSNPMFEFIRHDITIPFQAEVDLIYNLACPASPIKYQLDPIKTISTSVIGAFNVLNLAKNINAKVLQASTSEVYGDPLIHPQIENYWGNVNPIGIRSCYDEGKRCAETIFMDYHIQKNVLIKIIRIFNTFGPRMQIEDGRVISNFICQALRGENITIFGDGLQTRSFQYVDDFVEATIRMMNSDDDFLGPINIGNPCEFSILKIAEIIIELTGSKSKLIFNKLPDDDPRKRQPDITLAKEKLSGWQPSVQLKDGLIKTINYFETII